MVFLEEIENKIQAIYLKVLEKRHLRNLNGKTLNCQSFRKIAEEIKYVIRDGSNEGAGVIDIAGSIVLKVINENYFVHENHEMAALIGYIYLVRQNVKVKNYSIKGISNISTSDEIKNIITSWL